MSEDTVKTGTTTVGILCKEGVVLAADTRATAGYMIVDKYAQKIHQVTDNLAVTIAGTVSDIQLLIKLLKAELNLKRYRTNRGVTVREAANLLSDMVYGNIRKFSLIPGISQFIIGGYDQDGLHLYDLFPDGSLTKIDDYVSSGSGSVFALGALESHYKKEMTLAEAHKLAVRAVNTALQRDIASGNGIDVVLITPRGIERQPPRRLETNIEA
ncbi:proteasome subunit beta [Candidatus Woesearchaeota archaeon]|nr:proteasome subunit beta [Candidatus Woesearchaeota archaeon]